MRTRLVASLVLSLLFKPLRSWSQSPATDADVVRGIDQVKRGEYDAGITTLDAASRNLSEAGAGKAGKLSEAYLYLGVAYLAKGHQAAAREKFRQALAQARDLRPGADDFSPEVIDLFEAVRAEAPDAGATPGGAPSLDHDALDCIEVESYPELEAGVEAANAVRKVRVFFKSHDYPDWYYTEMSQAAASRYLGLLPKPLPETQRVDYYIEALDTEFLAGRTGHYQPEVSKEECRRRPTGVGSRGTPEIRVFGTRDGQAPVPPGFSADGIVAFVALTGGTVTGAMLTAGGSGSAVGGGAAGGGGGGLSATTIGVIAAGGAGGVLAAVAAGGSQAVDADGDGFTGPAGDCNDADRTISPQGVTSASFQVLQDVIGCDRQRATVTFENKSCQAIAITNLEINQVTTSPASRVEQFNVPFPFNVVPGTRSEANYMSDPYCCRPQPCTTTQAFDLRWEFRFRTATGGTIDAGSDTFRLMLTPGCPVCP